MIDKLRKYRRDLHQIPELDDDLPLTYKYLEAVLKRYPCTLSSPTKSSLCAYFDFHQVDTIAFRSDMDALPIVEQNQVAYRSTKEGCMHACGHDAHMAMVLGFADVIAKQTTAKHNVLLIFQPAEETTGGAQAIVDSGIFEQYHVAAIFGFHVWPDLASGIIASRPGPLMARSSEVNIQIIGKSAHAARYEEGLDALHAGIDFLHRAYAMEESLDAEIPRLLKFGKITSGTVRNVISNHTAISGTLRTYDENIHTSMKQSLQAIASQVQEESGCHIDLHFSQGYPPLINDASLFEQCANLLPNLQTLDKPSLLAEDFACYLQHLPGVFFYLGVGPSMPLHSSTFDLDEAILLHGVKTFETLLTINLA